MANITVNKNGNAPAPMQQTAPEWDPARWMRGMLSWDPFREMAPFFNEERVAFVPAFEIKETTDAYVFKADVPGIKQEDLEVHLTGNRLTISGKREAEKKEQKETFYAYERSYGSFTRAFTLPEGVDEGRIVADLRDGVLTLSVPKKPEMQPKKITVSTPQTTKS